MAQKRGKFSSMKPHQKRKFSRVMGEYAKGKLRSSSGQKVTDKDQALAIAFSEARRAG